VASCRSPAAGIWSSSSSGAAGERRRRRGMIGGSGWGGEGISGVGRAEKFSGMRGSHFWLSSAVLTCEARIGLLISAVPRGRFRVRWALPNTHGPVYQTAKCRSKWEYLRWAGLPNTPIV
jgi:hypothetical protein